MQDSCLTYSETSELITEIVSKRQHFGITVSARSVLWLRLEGSVCGSGVKSRLCEILIYFNHHPFLSGGTDMVTATSTASRIDSTRGFRVDHAHELQTLIQRTVHSHLLNGVDVHVQEQGVRLTGNVSSWYEKQLAQETVRAVAPRHLIFNELKVSFS
jgi:hypothetical protein